jgi:PGF-CTERM protein
VGDGPPVGSAALVDLLSETAGSSLTAYYGTATGPQAPPQLPTNPAVYDHDGTTQVTGTPTPTSTATATPTSSPPTTEPTATPGQPGLGPLVALAALVAVGLVRRRTG